jgi:hypothetical protein
MPSVFREVFSAFIITLGFKKSHTALIDGTCTCMDMTTAPLCAGKLVSLRPLEEHEAAADSPVTRTCPAVEYVDVDAAVVATIAFDKLFAAAPSK